MKNMESDAKKGVNDLIGDFGFSQKYIFASLFILTTVISWHSVTVTFLAPRVEFWCKNPQIKSNLTLTNLIQAEADLVEALAEQNGTKKVKDIEDEVARNLSHMTDDLPGVCECQELEFSRLYFKNTLTEKLGLVCERGWLSSFGSSLYMFGGLLGSIVFGQVADSIGRRKTMLALIIPTIVANLLILFAYDYTMFAVGQFVCGAAGTGLFNVLFVLMMETVGAEYRSVLGTSIEFSFSTGHLLLLFSAFILRDWFYIQAVAVAITAFLAILIWFLPESPSWLLVTNQIEEAKKVIGQIAKRNNLRIENLDRKTALLRENTHSPVDNKNKASVLDLFRTPRLRIWSIIILSYCFTAGFIFYGISLNIGIFGTDLFMDFFLSTIITYPAGIICIFIVRYVCRRKTLAGIALATGFVCLAYSGAVLGPEWVAIAMVTLAKCFVTPAFPVSNTYVAELYPTTIRSIGMGAAGLTARVGAAVSPFAKELGELTDPRVPMALFAGCAIVCGFSVYFLPETKDRKLPDTVEEREQLELVNV